MSHESLLAEFRVAGRDDVIRLYEEMALENAAAKKRIHAAFDGALEDLETVRGVGVELGRVRDALLTARRMVVSADMTPHPSAADHQLEAEARA